VDEQPDGKKERSKIVQPIEDHESSLEDNPTKIQFRVSVNNDKAEEIITYNKMISCGNSKESCPMRYKDLRLLS
jgi:hypothetical protein